MLSACAAQHSTIEKKDLTNFTIDETHFNKEIVITFPAWTSESDKLAELNLSAKDKALNKCKNLSYKITDLNSNRFVGGYGFSGVKDVRNNAISANIQCDEVIKDISTASFSKDKNNVNNLPECQGSDISRWTNCFDSATFPNGNRYLGEWKDGLRHGYGTYTWPNGSKYIGEFKDDKRDGQATYTYDDGSNYIGEFKDDKRHGQGTIYSRDGSLVTQGIWENGFKIPSVTSVQQVNQQVNIQSPEVSRLKAEAEEAKRKQTELEQQLRLSQNQPPAPPVLSTSPPVTAPFMGKRLALVIGNSSYKVRPLLNPRNDADDVSRVLRSTGFEVIDLRDATLGQMRASVRQFGERLMSNDVGLVYYSGHGIEVKGRNYFIPVNADIKASDEVADQALDVSLILAKMDTAKKGINILIVDACRDDPFGRSFRSNSRGLATMDAPQGTLIAYATAPGSVAADGTGRNSPFTKHLVRAMQVPNTPIELMFKEVRRAVREETKNQQTPWENSSLIGNFYFSVKK